MSPTPAIGTWYLIAKSARSGITAPIVSMVMSPGHDTPNAGIRYATGQSGFRKAM